jgi:hypothetical protein
MQLDGVWEEWHEIEEYFDNFGGVKTGATRSTTSSGGDTLTI